MSKWWENAACKYKSSQFQMFGMTESKYRRSVKAQQKAARAIAICRQCPVLEECRTDISKGGYSEMIAAGLLPWEQPDTPVYNIIVVGRAHQKPPSHFDQCGTRNGFELHAKHKERPCQSCVNAQRIYHREKKRQWRARRTA